MTIIAFDILCTIKIEHDYYANEPCLDFELFPTKTCQQLLKDHKLIFKSMPDGGMILFQKNEKKEILNKIAKTVKFTFFIKLKTPIFENFTRLIYPIEKFGRKFYYFSNLNNAGLIDSSVQLAKSADNKVGDKDFTWLVSQDLDLSLNNVFSKVELTEIPPKSIKKVVKTFNTIGQNELKLDFLKFIETSPSIFAPLKKGKYVLEFSGLNPKNENIYFDENLWNEDFWGIIELFKDENTNYTTKIEHKLVFRTERWKYYLIDETNKITLNPAGNAFTNFSTNSTGQVGLAFEWIKEADIENFSHEKRIFKNIKDKNIGSNIYLLRSNQSMKKPAESLVKVKFLLDGIETSLPTPKREKSKLEVIQKI